MPSAKVVGNPVYQTRRIKVLVRNIYFFSEYTSYFMTVLDISKSFYVVECASLDFLIRISTGVK